MMGDGWFIMVHNGFILVFFSGCAMLLLIINRSLTELMVYKSGMANIYGFGNDE